MYQVWHLHLCVAHALSCRSTKCAPHAHPLIADLHFSHPHTRNMYMCLMYTAHTSLHTCPHEAHKSLPCTRSFLTIATFRASQFHTVSRHDEVLLQPTCSLSQQAHGIICVPSPGNPLLQHEYTSDISPHFRMRSLRSAALHYRTLS